MKLFLRSLFLLLLLFKINKAKANVTETVTPAGFTGFTENKGQVSDQNGKTRHDVLYSGTDGVLTFHLKNNGISYQLNKINLWTEMLHKGAKTIIPTNNTVYRLDINWLNINTNPNILSRNALAGYSNFYRDCCPQGILNVKTYGELVYRDILPGIDLKWAQKDGHLKYEYVVSPGADYKKIILEIKGSTNISLGKAGELVVATPIGNIVEAAPLVYQNGKTLKSKWVIRENYASFQIEKLDLNKPYIIDPCVRIWGTWYGGLGVEFIYGCKTDTAGNVYITGLTGSSTTTLVATSGAYQTNFGGTLTQTSTDGFLAKFTSSGVRLWATYYGGSGYESANDCALDQAANIYITGSATSTAAISSIGSYQSSYGGGNNDAYLAKFTTNGVRLWATYFGDFGDDQGYGCSTDLSGNVFIVGQTSSPTSSQIATPGCHQSAYGGNIDAFLVKYNSAGSRQWSTFLGGSNVDQGFSCVNNAAGDVYVTGYTNSSSGTVIATAGSHQSNIGTLDDAFLVKFNSAGIRQWGTYYGGSGYETGSSCALDGFGNIYLSGQTTSSTGVAISSTGSHQTIFGGMTDAFLAKFNSSGVRQWGTYYGGAGTEEGYACATNIWSDVFLSGITNSGAGNEIATLGSHQSTTNPLGYGDAFLVKFNFAGIRDWGTYYGGDVFHEWGYACTADLSGNVYLAGCGEYSGGTVIATPGAHQTNFVSTGDGILVKFSDCVIPNTPINISSTIQNFCANGTATLSAVSNGYINWYAGPTTTAIIGYGSTFYPVLTAGSYTFYADATCGSTVSSGRVQVPVAVNVNPLPTLLITGSSSVCSGNSVTMTVSGASTYTWFPSTISSSVIVTPQTSTSYSIIGKDANGCVSSIIHFIQVYPLPTVTVNSGTICALSIFTLLPTGAMSYSFSGGTSTVIPNTSTTYSVFGSSSFGCIGTALSSVSVNSLPVVSISSSNNLICEGESATLIVTGALQYLWNNGSNLSSLTVNPTTNTIYQVTGTNANNCSATSSFTQNVNQCTNVGQKVPEQKFAIKIFPNPSNGNFVVETSEAIQVLVVDVLGQIILEQSLSKGRNNIDLCSEPPGLYFVINPFCILKLINE